MVIQRWAFQPSTPFLLMGGGGALSMLSYDIILHVFYVLLGTMKMYVINVLL